MVIVKQCVKCKEVGKKMYCNNCQKSIDYFQVFEDVFGENYEKKSTLIHTIKAFTWNDVIKFVKDEYFKDQDDLIIDCEKEFAYLERNTKSDTSLANSVKQSSSYRIFLKNENDFDLDKNTIVSNMVVDLTVPK
ncbi:MAG TPA: hypothetical protein VJR94_07710 [Candidatus Nitrosocosmicus sp.]|nr:hypothetical protein [Candidatus Nitrosocosmicus sp.]